ncbi:hypothetical protein AK812_SmicGene10986 [Symbiodinium microadriaticum]|uniref:Secretory immunoglobulin A-binding protein EsiB n=1 Tax=Symbiodinium microadriaticum TaxID=2951 RepID=A0A1Q9EEG6_SYMMI|nr:hypothetical protein AK812_SmicGene10986 [Symbiodinium microadriaticum]
MYCRGRTKLVPVQPVAVDSQPLDAEESTLKLFRASGAWFFEPPTATERPGQRSKEAATAPEEDVETLWDEEKLLELEAKSRSDYNLGVRLLRGKGIEKDEAGNKDGNVEPHELKAGLMKAFKEMDIDQQGVGKDEVLAGAYLKQAAQAGDPKAMYNLSLMYQNAIGSVKRDLDVAKEWMEQAAKRGHKKASDINTQLL